MPSFFAPDYVHLTRQNDSQSTLSAALPRDNSEASDDGTTYLTDDISAENASAIVLMPEHQDENRRQRRSLILNGNGTAGMATASTHTENDETAAVNGGSAALSNGLDPTIFIQDFRKTGLWRRRTKLEKALALLVLACLIGFFCVVLVLIATSHSDRGVVQGRARSNAVVDTQCDGPPICASVGCVKAASNLLAAIDQTKDPCDNFFDFACGQWNRDHPIPDDVPSYGTFAYVRDIVRLQLKGLLEESTDLSQKRSRSVDLTRLLYRSCLNTSWLTELKGQPMVQILKKFDPWPIFNETSDTPLNLTDMIGRIRRDYSLDVFINLYVYADARNTSNNILTIDQGSLGLGQNTRDYYLNDTLYGAQIAAYRRYLVKLARLTSEDMGKPLDDATLRWFRQQAIEMIDFERKLANITSPDEQRRNHTIMYNKWNVKKLKEVVPAIDWDAYFKLIMPAEVSHIVNSDSFIFIVPEPGYMKRLNDILLKTEPRILANYVIWRLVRSWSKMLDARYDDAFQEFVLVMMGRQQKPVRWKVCVPATVGWMEMAAGALYVRRYFNEDDKREAVAMIHNLRAAFKVLVTQLDWMDEHTKSLAIEKSMVMLENIGYPDFIVNDTALDRYYEELKIPANSTYFDQAIIVSQFLQKKEFLDLSKPFDRRRFEVSPAVVNAFYSPEKNAITFPAGILQPPFFKGDYPKSINYGAMGAVIGHEITHGFDDQGSQYDQNGNLHDWWSEMAASNFRVRTQCIVEQYNNYVVPEVNAKVNGRLTQGENIADNGGVKEAFRAYRHYIGNLGHEEGRLPGLQNYTNDQIFFLSYANFWCGHKKPAAAVQQVLTDPHSPEMFRVIGVLSNSEEFANAFSCRLGSQMNPLPNERPKCTVW